MLLNFTFHTENFYNIQHTSMFTIGQYPKKAFLLKSISVSVDDEMRLGTQNLHNFPEMTISLECFSNFRFIYSYETSLKYIRLLDKPYVNEITLRGQKPPLQCCQRLDFKCAFLKGLDLLLLKVWSLQVNGLQSYQPPSNFENDSNLPGFESWLTGSSSAGASWQTFS